MQGCMDEEVYFCKLLRKFKEFLQQKTQLIQQLLSKIKLSLNYQVDYEILKEVTKYIAFKPRMDLRSNLFETYDKEIEILKLKN